MHIQRMATFVKPPFIIADLDGTLALFGNRNPYNRDFTQDVVNQPVLDAIWALRRHVNADVIIMSGRSATFAHSTSVWLNNNDIPCERLYMRDEGDRRPDEVVKQEFLLDLVGGANHKIHSIFDDRPRMVRHWRSKGFFVFDCNTRPEDGDF